MDLIKTYEGCRLNAYKDVVDIPTIGYGSRYINGIPVKMGQTITQQQADNLLQFDINSLYNTLKQVLPNLTDNQFIALIDFCYNLGMYTFLHSTMYNMLKSGNISGAAEQFVLWDHAGGKVLPGLLRRRQQEQSIFEGNS